MGAHHTKNKKIIVRTKIVIDGKMNSHRWQNGVPSYMNSITRMVGSNGEIITILPISIKVDRHSSKFYAYDESSRLEYSIPELEQLANTGDPSAQCAMGDYYNSEERHADYREAFMWYKKAAAQNHAKALWNMGNFYAVGAGGAEKDFGKASALLEESANYGFIDAMLHLGQVLMMNDAYDKSIYWLEMADKLGHPEASKYIELSKMLQR